MVQVSQQFQGSLPPARQLRLLANLAPGATVVLGLLTIWLAVATWQSLAQPLPSAAVISLAVNAGATVIAGLATYRLGVGVPRVLRDWQSALADRESASFRG